MALAIRIRCTVVSLAILGLAIAPASADDGAAPLADLAGSSGVLDVSHVPPGAFDAGGLVLDATAHGGALLLRKNLVDDGTRWDPGFGNGVGCNRPVSDTFVAPDGKIYITGDFSSCGNVSARGVAVWDPVAGVFTPLGSGAQNGIDGSGNAITANATDVFVAGFFLNAGGTPARGIARYNLQSGAWSTLGTGADEGTAPGAVSALVAAGNRLFLAGYFTQVGSVAAGGLAQFDLGAASQPWAALGGPALGPGGVPATVSALLLKGSRLYVGGEFTQIGGIAASRLAWLDTTTGTFNVLGSPASNGVGGSPGATVYALSDFPGGVAAGGNFPSAGGVVASNIALYNEAQNNWSSLSNGTQQGTDGVVYSMAWNGTGLGVVGDFATAGGITVNRIALFTPGAPGAWASLGVGAPGANLAFDIDSRGADFYASGNLAEISNVAVRNIGRFNGLWSPVGTGRPESVGDSVFAIVANDTDVYIGGYFDVVGEVVARRIARWNRQSRSWFALGAGSNNGISDPIGNVRALALYNNVLYVGGNFNQAGTVPVRNVASFNTSTDSWAPLGSGPTNGTNSTVLALAVAEVSGAPQVFVGGLFNETGGASSNRVARFLVPNNLWLGFGAGTTNGVSGPIVSALAVSGTAVIVGGTFTTARGALMNNIGRFNPVTATWSPIISNGITGVTGSVNALAVVGADLYAAGDFTQAGSIAASKVAKLSGSTWSPLGQGADGVGGSGIVYAMTATPTDVIVGGTFVSAGGSPANGLARFDGTSWRPLGIPPADGADSIVYSLASRGTDVFAGGLFQRAGAVPSPYFARYDNRRDTLATISVGPASSVTVNTPVQFTASVTAPSYPGLLGAVDVLQGEIPIAGCAAMPLQGGLNTRTAACSILSLPVGTASFRARYSGDEINYRATSDSVQVVVVPPGFSFSQSALPSATFGVPGYSSNTIAVSTAAGTGVISPVSFQIVDAGLLPPGLTATPQANGLVITGTPTQAGAFTFTVRATDSSSAVVGGPFDGNRQYTIVVARASQTITPITRVDAVPLDNGVAFADGSFAVQAGASSGLAVAIDSTTPTVCAMGAPGFTVQPLQIGTCTLRARQAGNSNYEPAADVLRTFQVKATPDVFVASAPNPSVYPFGAALPDAVVLTATVETPVGATPTGTVRFQRAGNTIAGCAAQPLSGSGSVATATCNTTNFARGANAITAQYSGDALNVLATSNAHTHQLNVGTAVGIATITPSPCVVGAGCTVAVAVDSASGVPSGSVQVGASVGGSCTVTLQAGGGTCALTATTAGTGTVSATYLGSPPWLASPAATQQHPFVATVSEIFGDGFEQASANDR